MHPCAVQRTNNLQGCPRNRCQQRHRRKITERLAANGYFVYATARKEEDLKALGAIKNIQPYAWTSHSLQTLQLQWKQ